MFDGSDRRVSADVYVGEDRRVGIMEGMELHRVFDFFDRLSLKIAEREERAWYEAYECGGEEETSDEETVEDNEFFTVRRATDTIF